MSEESKKKIFLSMIAIIIAIVVFLVIFIFAKASNNENTNITTNTTANQVKIEEMQLKSSTSGAFAMPITYVGNNNKGITITGTIERGNIKVDDELQIVGMGKEVINAKVVKIEKYTNNESASNTNTISKNIASNTTSNVTNNTTQTNTKTDNSLKQASKGDEIILTIVAKDGKEIQKENIVRGQVACEPYTYNQYNTFTAKIQIDSNNSLKITDISKLDGEDLQIYVRIVDINGKVKVTKADTIDSGTISVKLESYVAIEEETQISIRKSGKNIATGTITTVSNT